MFRYMSSDGVSQVEISQRLSIAALDYTCFFATAKL